MPGGSSLPYSVTKAACKSFTFLDYHWKHYSLTDNHLVVLHLTKCLAKSQGPKVRVNAVCPGLLLTEWVSSICYTPGCD